MHEDNPVQPQETNQHLTPSYIIQSKLELVHISDKKQSI